MPRPRSARRPSGRVRSRRAQAALLPALLAAALSGTSSRADETKPAATAYQNFDGPPHHYRDRTPTDRFTRMLPALALEPDAADPSPTAALVRFLRALDVPASSQLLVFSTTSLQLQLISPENPRAIYFNDDLYVGFIPGGRLEIVSLDPDLGAVFYISDLVPGKGPLHFERSGRCMNCHAGEDTGYVPGLAIKSVVPGPGGGTLDAFRRNDTGHAIPFSERFGGWHVTGAESLTNHWGNLTGRLVAGEIQKIPNPPGARFSWANYPVATSDILAHLLLEHQTGFVNRAVEAAYRARTDLYAGGGALGATAAAELDAQAALLVRYLLFADEAPLPPGGLQPDPAFRADFLKNRRPAPDGASLKDLDLRTRLFKHRCSYMIYSPAFTGLPPVVKTRVYARLGEALDPNARNTDFAYLPAAEKTEIRTILRATLTDLPPSW